MVFGIIANRSGGIGFELDTDISIYALGKEGVIVSECGKNNSKRTGHEFNKFCAVS